MKDNGRDRGVRDVAFSVSLITDSIKQSLIRLLLLLFRCF